MTTQTLRRSIRRRPRVCLQAFALVCAGVLSLTAAAPAPAAERVLLGYYATFGKLPVEQIPWKRLTHLCHAFLPLTADGKLAETTALPNAALTADGRQAGVPVLVTVGGGATVAGLEKATATAESTDKLAAEITEVVLIGKYAGVDLDWEFPRNAATRAGHARLVLALRKRLDAAWAAEGLPGKPLLTVAVSPSPFFGEWIDADRIVPAVDWLGVMAYDLSGPWSQVAAHHAPLFASSDDPERDTRSVAAAMRYWETTRGVSKGKLLLGAPLFGRAMPAAERHATLDADDADRHRALPFATIRGLVGEGWPAEWDNESRAPWLRKPIEPAAAAPADAGPLTPIDEADPAEAPELISYDDRNSIHLKATWAREQGYRGLFFWAIHQDRMADGRHWLLEAANRAWPVE